MDMYKEMGAEVAYYDPYVPVIRPTREHPHWAGTESVVWDEATVRSFDCVVIATDHANVDYDAPAGWCDCFVDTRNAMNGREGVRPGQVWKA